MARAHERIDLWIEVNSEMADRVGALERQVAALQRKIKR